MVECGQFILSTVRSSLERAGLFDITQAFQNKLSVWALGGTGTLRSPAPHLTISTATVGTEVFTRALSAFQKPGRRRCGRRLIRSSGSIPAGRGCSS